MPEAKAAFEMKIEGLEEIQKTFGKMAKDIDKDWVILNAMKRIGKECEGRAKAKAPIDTGLLRSRVEADNKAKGDMNELSISVRAKTHYAAYVEFGTGIYAKEGKGRKTPWLFPIEDKKGKETYRWTKGMKAQPFLMPAAEATQNDMRNILKDAIMDYLNKKSNGGI